MTGEEEEDRTGVVEWSIWDGFVKDFQEIFVEYFYRNCRIW
jgi:hypothetical protein